MHIVSRIVSVILVFCCISPVLRAQNPTIVNGDGSAFVGKYCYDSTNYEIRISTNADGRFDGCGVFQRNGRWYINPIAATVGVTVFPYQCNLTYTIAADNRKITKTILIYKPVIIYPPLEDTVTCNGHFELYATTLYAGAYDYKWFPVGFLERPDTSVTKGFIQKTQKFTIIAKDVTAPCEGRDSLIVHYIPLPKPEIQAISMDGHTLSTKETYDSYQWLFNGQKIHGAESAFLLAKEDGSYQVIVGNEVGCTDTSDVYTIETVSINGDMSNAVRSIAIYPNPATDIINVEGNGEVNLSIAGIDGRILKQQSGLRYISTAGLPGGLYLLHINGKDGTPIQVVKFQKL